MLLSLAAIGLTGLLLGLLGGGGSVLILPLLVYLVGIDPVMSTSYSLVIVGSAALFGATKYLRQGLVDMNSVVTFGIPSVAGVFLTRSLLMPAIPEVLLSGGRLSLTKDTLVMIVFAILILASGVSMICKSNPSQSNATPKPLWTSVSAGILLGVTTGFVGAGGGFMIVPALIFLLGVPIRMAIGTSLLIIALKSLLGFVADAVVLDGIQWGLLLKFIIVATIGIAVGVRLNQRVPAEKLKVGFGWMVLAIGIGILVQEFS